MAYWIRIGVLAFFIAVMIGVYVWQAYTVTKELEEKGDIFVRPEEYHVERALQKCTVDQNPFGWDSLFTEKVKIEPRCTPKNVPGTDFDDIENEKSKVKFTNKITRGPNNTVIRQCCFSRTPEMLKKIGMDTTKKDKNAEERAAIRNATEQCVNMKYTEDDGGKWVGKVRFAGETAFPDNVKNDADMTERVVVEMTQPSTLANIIESDSALKSQIGTGGITSAQAVDICARSQKCGMLVLPGGSKGWTPKSCTGESATCVGNVSVEEMQLDVRDPTAPIKTIRFSPESFYYYKSFPLSKANKASKSAGLPDFYLTGKLKDKTGDVGDHYDYYAIVPWGTSYDLTFDRPYGDRPYNSQCNTIEGAKKQETMWPIQPGGQPRRKINKASIITEVDTISKDRITTDKANTILKANPHLGFYPTLAAPKNSEFLKARYAASTATITKLTEIRNTCVNTHRTSDKFHTNYHMCVEALVDDKPDPNAGGSILPPIKGPAASMVRPVRRRHHHLQPRQPGHL